MSCPTRPAGCGDHLHTAGAAGTTEVQAGMADDLQDSSQMPISYLIFRDLHQHGLPGAAVGQPASGAEQVRHPQLLARSHQPAAANRLEVKP